MEEKYNIIESIIFDNHLIFIIYGDNQEKYEYIQNYFEHIGAITIPETPLISYKKKWIDKDDAYRLAYSNFLIVNNFDNFNKFNGSSIKSLVSGETFQCITFRSELPIFIDNPSPKFKKLIIFTGKDKPYIPILNVEKALEARIKFINIK